MLGRQLTLPTRSSTGWGGHLFTQMLLLGKPRIQSALNCTHSVGAHLCAFPGQTPQLLSRASVLCRVGTTLPWGGLEGTLDVGVPSPRRLAGVLGGWGPSPTNSTSPRLPEWAGCRLGSCPKPRLSQPLTRWAGRRLGNWGPSPTNPTNPRRSPGGRGAGWAVAPPRLSQVLPWRAGCGWAVWDRPPSLSRPLRVAGPGPYQHHVAGGDVHVGLHGLL